MQFNPLSLELGIIPPGETVSQQTWSEILSSSANVSASIANDTSGGAFKVATVGSFLPVKQFIDPGELGPGHVHGKPVATTVYQPVAQTDGVTKLAVTSGHVVAVEVQFTGQGQSTGNARTATLQINGDTWDPIAIPLSALTGQISIQLPAMISVVQRGTISLPFKVTSIAGPPTTVSVSTAPASLLPPGISLSASLSSTQVSKSQQASGILRISAAIQATPGTYQLGIFSSAFNGALTNTFGFSLNVVVLKLNPSSPIGAKYLALGGPQGILGPISGDEAFCSDLVGQFRSYKNGAIFWSGVEGAAAFAVLGPILNNWLIGDIPLAPGQFVPTLDEAAQGSLGYPPDE